MVKYAQIDVTVQIPASYAGQCGSVIEGFLGLSLSIAAAVVPDDEVEGFKMLQLTAVPDATFCAAVGGWSLSIFQHQRQPMKCELATRNA
jgi:hypothetical protein